MKRYLIKVTYTEGIHAGESYLLTKGGYCTDEDSIHWEERCYKTEGIARRICKKLYEDNELSRKIERQDEECRIKRGLGGKKDWYIYESKTYEPFEVDAVEY